MQHRKLFRTFSALVLPFVIQACLVSGSSGPPIGGDSPPAMNPAFDAYDVCIRNLPPVLIWQWGKLEDEHRECFRQTIQVNHLTLPAGKTSDQAFANYKACIKNVPKAIDIVGFKLFGNTENTARENCFTSAVQ